MALLFIYVKSLLAPAPGSSNWQMIFRSLRIKNFLLKLKEFETTNKKRREGIERKRKREKFWKEKKTWTFLG
jgi:hypothetical protein